MRGGLMVCGTTSDAGKSLFVTGLCRLLARRGISVAPFKAQNMANNCYVTSEGLEIGRAQAAQAMAAGVKPEVAMNPVLLKPTGDRTSQVVVMGRPLGHFDARAYHDLKPSLLSTVLGSLADLRARFDVVVCEGAGSPAEINLLSGDIVNLRVAHEAGLPAVVVGDIDRGGVFAALYGTVELLPPEYRRLVRGFVINKLRGDPALLGDGLEDLRRRCGVPTLGVLPYVSGVSLDAEDSLALSGPRPRPEAGRPAGDVVDVAVVALPRIANFTDLDALGLEPGVQVRMVSGPAVGDADLVIVPGTKATVSDLDWMRGNGLDRAITAAATAPDGPLVLGICGGLQMMGASIDDPVESGRSLVSGLGLLPVDTTFTPEKVTRQRRGRAMGALVTGYEVHHGVTVRRPGARHWIDLDDCYGAEAEGVADGRLYGTGLHGLFEQDGFRTTFLAMVAERRGKHFVASGTSFAAARRAQEDRLADLIEAHVDMAALEAVIAEGALVG
ncbi:MAG TPA: cobyric acid synthase [Acidimicrobiales bacterium]|nr:cobyric acid synthase [Acidimicrobiales bacterium]